MGQRKETARDGQFQPRYDNIFKRPPGPTPEEKHAAERAGKCIGNDDTCGARRAKGTEYCVGHMRSLGLLEVKDDA